MLRLKKSELLSLKQLRKLCRLRAYDVLSVDRKHVTLNCVHHGHWVDKQVKVLANTAECPSCGKTRPFGKWSFDRDDWINVVKGIVPSIKFIDKSLVIEGRTLYKYRCKKCKAKFKNSLLAVLHPKFACPECDYRPSEKQKRKSHTALLNLRATIRKTHKARDTQFYLQDLKAAYTTLKEIGVVEYPPQIDVPDAKPIVAKASPVSTKPAVQRTEPPTIVEEADGFLDLDDALVKELNVQVEPEIQLVEEESSELELAEDGAMIEEESAPTLKRLTNSVAVYMGRGGHQPMRSSLQQLRDTYGNFINS